VTSRQRDSSAGPAIDLFQRWQDPSWKEQTLSLR
jgi:hypothetical protein